MESVKSFKRKMLLWTSNWSQDDQQLQSAEEVPFTPDAMEIAYLLQTTGFRIRFMDRCLPKEMHPVPGVSADSPACRVILMCPRSGIRIELDAPTSSCGCPSPDKSDLAKTTWSFNETAASEEMAKAADSLVSKPSVEISKTVSQFLGGLFQVMSLFPDLNHNNTKETANLSVSSSVGMHESESATSTSSNSSLMKTPATGIAVVTPNAPCIQKSSPVDSKTVVPGRYRSLDTLMSFDGFPDDLPEPGQLTPKDDAKPRTDTAMEVDGELDTTITHGSGSASKKFISKSSPAVNCTEVFHRSSTFTFEDDEKEVNPSTNETAKKKHLVRSNTYVEEEPRVGPPPRKTPSPSVIPAFPQSSILLSKLQEVQVTVSDIIFMVAGNENNLSNIGDVSKASKAVTGAVQMLMTDNTVRPIRCLSDFGSVPNLNRATTTVRSISRPNIRRYATTIASAPATPTTSRRGGTKKASTTTLPKTPTPKIGFNRIQAPPGSGLKKLSTSSSAVTAINKPISKDKESAFAVSPNRRITNLDKKYAHVQSSIPKPGIVRK